MTCEFHPEARREFFEAVAYYDEINLTLGNQFLQSVENVIIAFHNFQKLGHRYPQIRSGVEFLIFPMVWFIK